MIRKRIIILIILILLLMPDIWVWNGWEFLNFSYHENKRASGEWECFNAMPVPKYSYAYRSLFVDVRLSLDYCDDWEYWRDWDFTIFLGIEKWAGGDFYLPIFWFSLSDKDIDLEFLGGGQIKIGENWIDLP